MTGSSPGGCPCRPPLWCCDGVACRGDWVVALGLSMPAVVVVLLRCGLSRSPVGSLHYWLRFPGIRAFPRLIMVLIVDVGASIVFQGPGSWISE